MTHDKRQKGTTMLRKLRERADNEGFTLIELLIVITILGILAGIVVFAVGTTGSNATASACKADKKTVETAIEAFKAESATHVYPTAGDYTALVPAFLKEQPPEAITWDAGTGAVTGC
jgi:prepilin-type N-terminal cleavage/methylation domain-containing protein